MKTERAGFGGGEEMGVCRSPSPRPSPPRRGRNVRRRFEMLPRRCSSSDRCAKNSIKAEKYRAPSELFKRAPLLSLAPGERVGVRVGVFQTLLTAILLALPSGCAVGPDYHRPAALAAN